MKSEARSAAAPAALSLLLMLAPHEEFHQGVEYVIEARLDETTHVLSGRTELRYSNRSPGQLDTLYFHLHLNAFRPNSAWARRELAFRNHRFQNLGPDDFAFDRVSAISVDGQRVRPHFPFAPDSTVMAVPLRRPIPANGAATIRMDWQSRLSTVPRRQGRQGRHYDWAHWYPRIAVYDTAGWQINPLMPQGEFYGEFATYDVTLDLAADQVIGATGVPVSGDPGWERVNQTGHAPLLQRAAYPPRAARALGLLRAGERGRKRVRWIAEQVHHFAWSADPAYLYEGGLHGEVALHALYLRGDEQWPGRVIKTMASALQFYDSIFGPYIYPQLTSTRRLDIGGTEFPMLMMNEAAAPPVVHETGHQYAHAILANNEFREFWLDEGLIYFLGGMYTEAAGGATSYARTAEQIAQLDSLGLSQPIAQPADRFTNFTIFQYMSYMKAALVFHMLRWYMGEREFRAGLRLYYERNQLQHVDENDLRTAMAEAAGEDLDWFFEQWLHTVNTLDYAIAGVTSERTSTRQWRTEVAITRTGDIWMPVDVAVGERKRRVDSRERAFSVVIETDEEPAVVELDPDGVLIDVARGNNRYVRERIRK